jgi:uncharacterized protein YlxW (UPF0749 family)
MKKEDAMIVALGVLSVLVIVNLMATFQGSSIKNVTGSVVEEPEGLNKELLNEIVKLRGEIDILNEDKNELNKEIEDLKNVAIEKEAEKIKQEEIEEATCPLNCVDGEICVAINKADGSTKWQCVDDPTTLLGS